MEKVNNFLNHVLPKILSVILVFLIFTSMIDSNLIQGCARVVNYTASVRGGSQRIVKLVIMGQPYSDLINESEIILNELKNGGKVHNLVPLQSVQYQKDLAIMTQYWYALKQELAKVNVYGCLNRESTSIISICAVIPLIGIRDILRRTISDVFHAHQQDVLSCEFVSGIKYKV